MHDQPPIQQLKDGDAFLGFLLAQEAAYKLSRTGSEYLEARLGDATGELKGFLWDLRAIEGDPDAIRAEAFVKLKGQVQTFNGRLQLRIDKIRFAEDAEVGDLARFFPLSLRPMDEMLAEMDAAIRGMGDPWLRGLLTRLLIEDEGRRAAFAKAPAAKSNHHVYLGGLLEHTLSVLGMARKACEHYPSLHRDLVVAGVLLHDLGKIVELTYQRSFGYSDAGNLLGHITLESQWVEEAIKATPGFPEELRLQLLHILLSHHGKLEFGSPVLPKTPEALLVHYLDDLDGKLASMFKAISEPAESAWSPYMKVLERMVYRRRWPEAVSAASLTTKSHD